MSEKYNGWTNYETWQANIYLNEGQGLENWSRDVLKDLLYDQLMVDSEEGLKRDILESWLFSRS